MKVFYNKEQSVKVISSSPSPSKPAKVVRSWVKDFPSMEVVGFNPLTQEDLYQAHYHGYVDGVMSLAIRNGFGTRSVGVCTSLLHTTGSMVAATEYVMAHGAVAVSPTSGFHHAGYSSAYGYCTFNGLILAAMKAKAFGATRVVIIDCDMHYGDGTDGIIKTLGLGWITHITFGKWFKRGASEKDFLVCLKGMLSTLGTADVVLYQAGADPHIYDPLGGFLTTEGMATRDRVVFEHCHKHDLPLVWNLAGGYQEPVSEVVQLHHNTMAECLQVYV